MDHLRIASRLINDDNFDLGSLNRFARINALKKKILQEENHFLLDFGIGESDEEAAMMIVRKLTYEARKWENRVYADNGIDEFKKTAANYLNRTFDLNLDQDNINHCIGAKSALAILPFLFINPKDYLITTSPGYAVMPNVTKWLGGRVFEMKLTKENDFLPSFKDVPPRIAKKAKMIYLNYPNNPTGAVATLEFYQEAIEFAKKYNLFIVQDAAYLPLVFNKKNQISFLSVNGAMDVGVEVFTLSKGHNMTGWRIGFVAGDKKVISLFAKVKDVLDSGQFIPIQKAAITALNNPEIVDKNNQKYLRRHKLIVESLNNVGLITKVPLATFYQYVKVPKRNKAGIIFKDASDFAVYLLRTHQILVIPWDEAGSYVRFSMTFVAKTPEEEIKVAKELYERLKNEEFSYIE